MRDVPTCVPTCVPMRALFLVKKTKSKLVRHLRCFVFRAFLAHLQTVSVIAVNPTDASSIYAVSAAGFATSTDKGETWSPLVQAAGLTTGLTNLVIKDSSTMLALRQGKVPLRTQDGGKT